MGWRRFWLTGYGIMWNPIYPRTSLADSSNFHTLNAIKGGGAANRRSIATMAIDLSKAFNRLDHSKLLTILYDIGTPICALRLLRSYLTARSMRVHLKDAMKFQHWCFWSRASRPKTRSSRAELMRSSHHLGDYAKDTPVCLFWRNNVYMSGHDFKGNQNL